MIRISQIKLSAWHEKGAAERQAVKMLKLKNEKPESVAIVKRSIDARKKDAIHYIYTVEVSLKGGEKEEKKLTAGLKNKNITYTTPVEYHAPEPGIEELPGRIIIAGSGPAGLFCAYQLAMHGYRPLLIERGASVEKRVTAVERFWKTGELDPDSNVQFGEGGAGTFSDGKLNTGVKDESGRIREVLGIFAGHGAPEDILYLNKPHIGTDRLRNVVKKMRESILRFGGEVRFQTCLTDIRIENGAVAGITVNGTEEIKCAVLVLAVGHSARDTFYLLKDKNLNLQAKAFAVGLRIEHKQAAIGFAQYGGAYRKLPPADYKLTHTCEDKRGVYSFCMCPGGYVVNASSEPGRLAVNGMSNYARDAENANSALIVTVTPEDYRAFADKNTDSDPDSPLAGVEFQRRLEEKAYQAGRGRIPVERYGDFRASDRNSSNSNSPVDGRLNNRSPEDERTESMKTGASEEISGSVRPSAKGGFCYADLHEVIPEFIAGDIIEGIEAFNRKIPGFADPDALLSGVESRTSSPVRIVRDGTFESNIAGIYPCGEGAGYAGGITSAAVDGIRVFEAICGRYAPITKEDRREKDVE